MLKFIPDYYKSKKIFDKAVDNYSHALEFVLDCNNTQKMYNKAADTYPSVIQLVSKSYKTQKMCDKAVGTVILTLFFIDVRLKKCMIKLFPKNPLC